MNSTYTKNTWPTFVNLAATCSALGILPDCVEEDESGFYTDHVEGSVRRMAEALRERLMAEAFYDPEDHDDRAAYLADYTCYSRRERDAMLAATRDCDSDWATVLEDPDADCGPSLQAWGRLLAAVEDTHND